MATVIRKLDKSVKGYGLSIFLVGLMALMILILFLNSESKENQRRSFIPSYFQSPAKILDNPQNGKLYWIRDSEGKLSYMFCPEDPHKVWCGILSKD